MDALIVRRASLATAVWLTCGMSWGASFRTANFVVEAPSPAIAQQLGKAAEKYRRELAVEWLGREMPNWSQPCPITAQVGDHLGAGGATSFVFEHGEVFGWRMTIQGSLERILDSVLPHEVTHTIFATHFRRPLPRWADEGACTTVEHASERAKQQAMLVDFLRNGRGIAFARMFAMKEYPHDVMPLYSQGYSLARYLIAQGGKQRYLEFVGDGMASENWAGALERHYGVANLSVLQSTWLEWVRQGSPALDAPASSAALVAVRLPGPARGAAGKAGPSRQLASGEARPSGANPASGNPGASVYELASARGGLAEAAPVATTAADSAWRAPRGESVPEVAPVAGIAAADAARVGPADEAAPIRGAYQVTRPQPVGRPRQVILEWSKPPGVDQSALHSPPTVRR